VAFFAAALAGCTASSVKPPGVDADGAAAAAIELHDKDGDALLSEKELAACPGLLATLTVSDTSGDKQLSQEEISAKLNAAFGGRTGLTSVSCRATLDNRPLAGATIRLVPEAFLGSEVKSAEGVTDRSGTAVVGISEEELPEKLRNQKVVQPGIYRVEITHPSGRIPARYNTQTTLGYELDTSSAANLENPDEPVVFRLRSK
jgi:hypothetical protein